MATEESASCAVVISRADEVLDLTLPITEVMTNAVTEVLHPGQTNQEPLLLFSGALVDTLLGT